MQFFFGSEEMGEEMALDAEHIYHMISFKLAHIFIPSEHPALLVKYFFPNSVYLAI